MAADQIIAAPAENSQTCLGRSRRNRMCLKTLAGDLAAASSAVAASSETSEVVNRWP